MQPKTSRDLQPSPPMKDERRERQDAAAKDADKTDQADRNRIHGTGESIGLEKP